MNTVTKPYLDNIGIGTRSVDVLTQHRSLPLSIDGFFRNGCEVDCTIHTNHKVYPFDILTNKKQYESFENNFENKKIIKNRSHEFVERYQEYIKMLDKLPLGDRKMNQKRLEIG